MAGLIDLITTEKKEEQSPLMSLANSSIEMEVINKVADEYNLNDDERKLLFVIRKIENGKQGKEFGVLTKEAMRFANDKDPMKSFITQARWAAGTIKKRYKGNLEKFAKRWAPVGAENDPTELNKNWLKNAKFYMNK